MRGRGLKKAGGRIPRQTVVRASPSHKAYDMLGITGTRRRRAMKLATKAAEVVSKWLWNRNTLRPQVTSLLMGSGASQAKDIKDYKCFSLF